MILNSFINKEKGNISIRKKIMEINTLVISEEITAKIKIVIKNVNINNNPIRIKLISNIYYFFNLKL